MSCAGHSQVGNHIARLGPHFTDNAGGPLRLKQTYFNPKIVSEQGIDVFLRGALFQRARNVDLVLSNDVRNHLFPTSVSDNVTSTGTDGSGLDLASLNIQRGRDHGLPDYFTLRKSLGLPGEQTYLNVTGNASVAALLEKVYGPAKDNALDAWVGDDAMLMMYADAVLPC